MRWQDNQAIFSAGWGAVSCDHLHTETLPAVTGRHKTRFQTWRGCSSLHGPASNPSNPGNSSIYRSYRLHHSHHPHLLQQQTKPTPTTLPRPTTLPTPPTPTPAPPKTTAQQSVQQHTNLHDMESIRTKKHLPYNTYHKTYKIRNSQNLQHILSDRLHIRISGLTSLILRFMAPEILCVKSTDRPSSCTCLCCTGVCQTRTITTIGTPVPKTDQHQTRQASKDTG